MMAQKRRPTKPSDARKGNEADEKKPIHFLPPLKPHRAGVIVLGILLLLWLIVLVVMRLRTIQHSPRIDGDVPRAVQK